MMAKTNIKHNCKRCADKSKRYADVYVSNWYAESCRCKEG
jgi:coenzyme F420-reducing hydrogenase beta subunit